MNAMSKTLAAVAIAWGMLSPVAASAQTPLVSRQDDASVTAVRVDRAAAVNVRQAVARIVRESGGVAELQTVAPPPRASTTRERSVTRKIIGGAVGAVAGFFGGLYLGAAIEGDDCNCDDPGLKGALIGAPIGAIVGGIVGAKWF